MILDRLLNKLRYRSRSHAFKDGDKVTITGSTHYNGSFVVDYPKARNVKILVTLIVGILLGLAL
jgi:hypothetical protein